MIKLLNIPVAILIQISVILYKTGDFTTTVHGISVAHTFIAQLINADKKACEG